MNFVCNVGTCKKPKFCSDLVLKTELSKDLTSDQTVETACNPPFRLKVTKSNFTRIKCADKECFKTRPKQSLGFRMQLHYLLVVVVSDIKVMSSTVVVTFAVN